MVALYVAIKLDCALERDGICVSHLKSIVAIIVSSNWMKNCFENIDVDEGMTHSLCTCESTTFATVTTDGLKYIRWHAELKAAMIMIQNYKHKIGCIVAEMF